LPGPSERNPLWSRTAAASSSRPTLSTQTRHTCPATLPGMATNTTSRKKTSATPWGAARTVEQLTIPQRAGEKRFATVVQLLETDKGERLVRFAYTTGGAARRGPVTMKLRDLERLRALLTEHPGLGEAFGISGGGA
jgi:hypothetical protein